MVTRWALTHHGRMTSLIADTPTTVRTSPVRANPLTTARDNAFTLVRAGALVVVVLWHWLFATVRWDANGPHTGNPMHAVPAGFVLTWLLQVMPLFFLIGGWASWGSLQRHQERGGGSRSWVLARARRLGAPVLPLVLGLVVARVVLSAWGFGVVLLAVSPLWFLGVYLPLTLLTPLLVGAHRRSPAAGLAVTLVVVCVGQYLRFVHHQQGLLLTLVAFLATWGFAYQLGFHLDRLRADHRLAVATALSGLAGIGVCVLLGYPASMVARSGEKISNMGPPTLAIVMLTLFQAGLVTCCASALGRLSRRPRVAVAVTWIDARQMSIYTWHLPIWTAVLVALRSTSVGLASTPTTSWLWQRPLWLVVPGVVLSGVLAVVQARQSGLRPRDAMPGEVH